MKDAIPAEGRAVRAGGEALSMLAAPLNIQILEALDENPRTLIDLRQAVHTPPQSTMRVYLRMLIDRGVIERQRSRGFPSTVTYEITQTGRDLLKVAKTLQEWLHEAPDGPIELGSTAAKSSTKALAEGWSTKIVRALAAQPLSLTELNRLIHAVSYPSLERRLSAMRSTKLVEARRNGRATPYAPNLWLRKAVVPLIAAADWEHRYPTGSTERVRQLDVQAAFMLALPLIEMPASFDGTVLLAVELRRGSSPVVAGVLASFSDGKLVGCTPRLEGDATARASGSPAAWFEYLAGSPECTIAMSGDLGMARAMLERLRALGARRRVAVAA